jgi:hypothetical protein
MQMFLYDRAVRQPSPSVSMAVPSMMTRRGFLTVVAGSALVAACGGDGADTAASATTGSPDGLATMRFMAEPSVQTGPDRRIVFGLANLDGSLLTEGPAEIEARLFDAGDAEIATVTAIRRDSGLPRAYYVARVDLAADGPYRLQITVDGETADLNFSATPAEAIPFPSVGSKMPGFDTPTLFEPRGVDPVCTRQPECSFHAASLNEALRSAERIAYLVGTPAFCQTAICGPILDLMLQVAPDYPDLRFLHTEVYTDMTATTVAAGVEALQLSFEPVIFLIDATGTVVERLDVIVDEAELRANLDALSA